MEKQKQDECAHVSCHCQVQGGEDYCSEYCRDAEGVAVVTCRCGHEPCRDVAHG